MELVSIAEEIGGIKLDRRYDFTAPKGVAGRNSDNTPIRRILNWEPETPLHKGQAKTYAWIEQQYNDRKAGKVTVRENYEPADSYAHAGHSNFFDYQRNPLPDGIRRRVDRSTVRFQTQSH
jgi:hypothetical protein